MVRAAPTAPIKNMNTAMMSANVNFAVHLPMARAVRTVRLANTAMVQVRINVFGAVQQAMAQGVPIARPENTKSRRILIEFTFPSRLAIIWEGFIVSCLSQKLKR